MPYFHVFEFLTVLKWWTILIFNKTELDVQRIEALWLLQVHRYFWLQMRSSHLATV